jgi:hypothetical protein
MPAFWNAAGVSGDSARLTPLLAAQPHWPSRMAFSAACSPASELLQAVSTLTAGPRRSKA